MQFLRYSIADEQIPPASAKGIDWKRMMMAWAEKQAIVGVIYGGIQKAGKEISIPFDNLMEWVGYACQIEIRNRLLNKRCVELSAYLKEQGFES